MSETSLKQVNILTIPHEKNVIRDDYTKTLGQS